MGKFKTEASWQKWVLEELSTLRYSWFFAAPTKSLRGIPDIIGCVGGNFVALELKLDEARPDKSRETLQKYTLDLMQEAGAPLCVDRLTPSNWPEVERKLRFLSTNPRSLIQRTPLES